MSSQCSPVPLYTILHPLFLLAARTPSNITYTRIQTSIFEPLFAGLVVLSSQTDTDEMEPRATEVSDPVFSALLSNSRRDLDQLSSMTPPELMRAMYQCLFDVASQQETRVFNRKKMYALWKEGTDDI